MPKKKVERGGDKPDEDKKTQKKDSLPERTEPDDKERALYLTQIRYLNEQLERYQLKSDELEREKKDLKAQCNVLEKEKKDIVEFLKRSLLEKEDEVDELTDRLESQRQASDEDRGALQLQHNQLVEGIQGRIDELTKENMKLVAKLDSLEEFQRQKEQLMSNMESLEKQLASQNDEHKNDIHNLEIKTLLEKKRLEKEVESFEAAMAAEVQQLVNRKVPETTRLALQENVELKSQLSELSAQAQVVEQLTEKCQQLQAEQKDNRQELKQLQTEHKGIKAELEGLRQERTSLSDQCSKNTAEVGRLEAALEEERRRRSRIKSSLQEAVVTLRQALMEEPTERGSVVHWKKLMQRLLLVLDKHSSSTADNEHLKKPQTSEAEAAGAVNLDPASSFQFQLARYRPGDLGLVPPPAPKHKNLLFRTGTGSGSTGPPLHRKPISQKAASSITLTDSAASVLSSKHSITKLKKL
ncbi:Cilia- and flagella-associated protein 157 [Channa argus]|uniref:Cilia- and flagella-associated protein 157 n=1 Tax=Channa argus TaxID=215402 RepID=A0A6G1PYJ8_CHAAH|nr:Cilia- and flagella-associated protein 157 [Channa argus]